jgi:hypothetical protein
MGFCDLPPKKPRLQRMEGDFDAMWQMWQFFCLIEHACITPPPTIIDKIKIYAQ